jgi:hypothetical protein
VSQQTLTPASDELRRFLPWLPAAAPAVAPVASPPPDPSPTPEEIEEKRRLALEAKEAADKEAEKKRLRRNTRMGMGAIILISAIITYVGSTNAHDLLIRHHTSNTAAWLLYPALEAGLVVEIQIGGLLAEYSRSVRFWGAALRIVTAASALTLSAAGPAELGDWLGAMYHALGPIGQFFFAEFLAHARPEFRGAAEDIEERTNAHQRPVRSASERHTKATRKRTTKRPSAPGRVADGRTKPTDETTAAPSETAPVLDDDDLLVRAHAAADELERTDQRLNRDNLVRAIRAGGGTIQNKDAGRLLAQLRTERGGPDIHPVRANGA